MLTLKSRAIKAWNYYNRGVWRDPRRKFSVNLIKVVNLTVRGFLDGSLQNRACAMTYRTLLAVVPMLALLLAIGRGFGLDEYLQKELLAYIPSQQKMLSMAFGFVDSYLAQINGGLFVGVGIGVLLWTVISLLGSVEEEMNNIWDVRTGRSFWRKITDYTAILLVLPILLICSGGISVMMSSTLQKLFNLDFSNPVMVWALDAASVALSWLFFAGVYMLIPNTKVRPLNALLAGVLAGTGCQVVQWLFVTGQMYVAKYNAIYGSFSFLPLMLVWLQLTWLITFIGARVCYASQNIFRFSFEQEIKDIAINYRLKAAIAILTVILARFEEDETPPTPDDLTRQCAIPPLLVSDCLTLLEKAGLVRQLSPNEKFPDSQPSLMPSHTPEFYTFASVIRTLTRCGDRGFLNRFDSQFQPLSAAVDHITLALSPDDADRLLTEINPIPSKPLL